MQLSYVVSLYKLYFLNKYRNSKNRKIGYLLEI